LIELDSVKVGKLVAQNIIFATGVPAAGGCSLSKDGQDFLGGAVGIFVAIEKSGGGDRGAGGGYSVQEVSAGDGHAALLAFEYRVQQAAREKQTGLWRVSSRDRVEGFRVLRLRVGRYATYYELKR
jgi:hypothetical protein